MTFAKRVFTWSSIYGVLVLLPLYFLEETNAKLDPPAMNHPEYYYGFTGVAFAWQAAYFLCGRDPIRFKPFMLVCALAKASWFTTAITLFLLHRCSSTVVASATPDAILCLLFLVAWKKTPDLVETKSSTP